MSPGADGRESEPLPARDATASSRRERLGLRLDPERVFELLLAGERHAFWLDAGIRAETGRSLLGTASPVRPSYLMHGDQLWTLRGATPVPCDGELTDVLRRWRLATVPSAPEDDPADTSPLGWVGWFGYEFGARRLGIEAEASAYPDAVMLAADRVIAIDHHTNETSLWFVDDADGREWAANTSAALRAAADEPTPHVVGVDAGARCATGPVRWRNSDGEYLSMIAACQDSIRAGDAYLLCLTNTATVATSAEPLEVYRALRRASRARHGAYLRAGDVTVLSASPELFLNIAGGVAVTRPVKGTRPRGALPADDARLRAQLAGDEKERAENLMIVDLMRNDLGRVARVGGVSVTELLTVETHAHVHQLVSTVRAELADGLDVLDVLGASFPAGSMTGAPKLSAMSVLHELERGPRGVYSGCLGRLGLDGTAELAMVIRTIVMCDREATIGSGGGITALSVPDQELAEVKLKAAALLHALGVTSD